MNQKLIKSISKLENRTELHLEGWEPKVYRIEEYISVKNAIFHNESNNNGCKYKLEVCTIKSK
mgnify:CR=1 FL=1